MRRLLASVRSVVVDPSVSGTSVNSNPYESPNSATDPAAIPRAGNSIHATLLGIASFATLLLALVNSIGEQLPTLSFTIGVTFAAVISQLPGIVVGVLSSRRGSRLTTALLFPAYFIAATGLLAYFAYAFNGQADSLESASHMHVIVFPIFHSFVAVVAYLLAAVLFWVVALVSAKP